MAGDTLKPAGVGILLSPAVDRDHGSVSTMAAQSGIPALRITAPADADELAAIDVAFFSRDLYQGSSLRRPAGPASTFFAIADAAPSLRWLRVVESFLARLGPWLRKHKARASSFQTTCRP
ncbi:MAG: hypothetical protein H0T52_15155 [Lautropia sp.]|nr:hypothetical protein [Lautropia sp.]